MTDSRAVENFGKGFLVASGATSGALSIYFESFTFVLFWVYFIGLFAIASVVCFLIWSVTIWSLVLLIAKVFTSKRSHEGTTENNAC